MTTLPPTIRRSVVLALMFAGVWGVAAGFRSDATFHLAPILITLGGPMLAAGAADPRRPMWATSIALTAGISLATTAVLAASGLLRGPSLLPFGGGAAEAVVFTAGAALIGLARLAAAPRARISSP